ncbi:MAG: sulfatase [Thermodesulfovibrionia bacterium]|nr:sulfatase [Thermodesulfovibrionia bacterium]
MRFADFLPDLSLAFFLWTVLGLILSVILWSVIFIFYRIIPKSIFHISLDQVTVFFVCILLLIFVKQVLLGTFSLSYYTGLNHYSLLAIGFILTILTFWISRKYIINNAQKALDGLNTHITPLVWSFALLFVLSIPLSILRTEPSDIVNENGINVHSVSDKESSYSDSNKMKRPNILFIVLDALTARDMSLYGYDRPTTPFISKWADDAIVFNRIYASSNWTSPTVMSMMTGQRLWTHGVWYAANRHASRNYESNLPRVLKDYGYDVYAFVQNRYAHPETLGIKEAFSKRENYHTYWLTSGWWFDDIAKLFVNRNIVMEWIFETNAYAEFINSFRPPNDSTLVPPENVYNYFLEFISKANQEGTSAKVNKPFFAWLHIYPPHEPYLPPPPYFGRFGDADRFSNDMELKESGIVETEYKTEMQAQVDILRKRYDEFIMYSDNQFEIFMTRLAGAIDLSNTIIILLSDHGESFNHGYQGHSGSNLYESMVHVPLIIKLPFNTEGKVSSMPAEQIDITPTILDLIDIPVPEWMEGRSLFPFIKGIPMKPKPVLSMQFIENRALGEPITKGTIAVWEGDYKLIHYLEEDKSLLFNLKSDPDEILNIIKDQPEIAEELLVFIKENLSQANKKNNAVK